MITHLDDFFFNVTAITVFDADEEIPYEENSLVFSLGESDKAQSVLVQVTSDTFDAFLAAKPSERQAVSERVFSLYLSVPAGTC